MEVEGGRNNALPKPEERIPIRPQSQVNLMLLASPYRDLEVVSFGQPVMHLSIDGCDNTIECRDSHRYVVAQDKMLRR